ncbi:MAG: helix-turn-helix domain-containing protein [Lentisphaerae bacterium]|nr:helix-turn-helix domain-containing protein [Lentisphaerota bacterium]
MRNVLPERLAEARKRSGLKSKELAALADVAPNVYSRYESGARKPAVGTVAVIAEKCGVTVDWLLGRSDDPRSVFLDGARREHHLRDEPGSFGTPPSYHTVQWEPQWNPRVGTMSREDICDMIEDVIPRLRTRPYGDKLAHACHYAMDLLNELANRRTDASTQEERNRGDDQGRTGGTT